MNAHTQSSRSKLSVRVDVVFRSRSIYRTLIYVTRKQDLTFLKKFEMNLNGLSLRGIEPRFSDKESKVKAKYFSWTKN